MAKECVSQGSRKNLRRASQEECVYPDAEFSPKADNVETRSAARA